MENRGARKAMRHLQRARELMNQGQLEFGVNTDEKKGAVDPDRKRSYEEEQHDTSDNVFQATTELILGDFHEVYKLTLEMVDVDPTGNLIVAKINNLQVYNVKKDLEEMVLGGKKYIGKHVRIRKKGDKKVNVMKAKLFVPMFFKPNEWDIDESFDYLYERAKVEPESKLWKPGGPSYDGLRDEYKAKGM